MKDISSLVKGAGKVLKENSPALLTAGAITGVVTTTYLVAKAAYRQGVVEATAGVAETPRERLEEHWQLYIPAALSGAATIAFVVGSNRVSTRRNAALLTALSLTERAFDEYKYKVVEQLGKGKEQKVRTAIAQDHVEADPVSNSQIIITGNGEVLMRDGHSGRYFESSIETLRRVQNDLNAKMMHEGYVSLNEFYEAIKLPSLRHGDDQGWNLDSMLNLEFLAVIAEDGRPCISVEFMKQPSVQYWKYS